MTEIRIDTSVINKNLYPKLNKKNQRHATIKEKYEDVSFISDCNDIYNEWVKIGERIGNCYEEAVRFETWIKETCGEITAEIQSNKERLSSIKVEEIELNNIVVK